MDMPELPQEEEAVTRMGQIQLIVPQVDEGDGKGVRAAFSCFFALI